MNFQLKWEKSMSVKVRSFLPGLYSLHRVLGFVLFCQGGIQREGNDQGPLVIIFLKM